MDNGFTFAEHPDFEPAPEPEPKASSAAGGDRPNWPLKFNKSGGLAAIEANVATFLRFDPKLRGRLRLNLMTAAPECTDDLPWSRPGKANPEVWREWTDADDDRLCEYVQRRDLMVSPVKCRTGVNIVAHEHEVHPVREYLDGLRWDGTKRLSSWLRVYCGAVVESDGTPPAEAARRRRYVDAVGRAWLISAVARAYDPGCKADHCLALEGPQGKKKSTAFEIMAVRPEWYSSLASALGSKDAMEDLAGSWIVELEELAFLRGKDVNRMKAYLSTRSDKYRNAYGRRSTHHPRHNVFAGSVNDAEYLADPTGGRRFWPVKIGETIDADALRCDRDQLLAETVVAYKAGEKWWLGEELETIAGDEQEERQIGDPWRDAIVEFLEIGTNKQRQWVTTKELLTNCIHLLLSAADTREQMRVATILRSLKWTKRQRRIEKGGNPVNIWVRPGCKHLDDDPEEGAYGGAYGPEASKHAASEEAVSTVNTVSTNSVNDVASEVGTARDEPNPDRTAVMGKGAGGADGAYSGAKQLNCNGKDRKRPGPEGAYGTSGKVLTDRFCRHCGELVDDRDRLVMTFADGSLAHQACDDARL